MSSDVIFVLVTDGVCVEYHAPDTAVEGEYKCRRGSVVADGGLLQSWEYRAGRLPLVVVAGH